MLAKVPVRRISKHRTGRRGFTLLECALAMVILGVGVMALIEAQSYFFTANQYSSSAATGTYLANELRERMRFLPKHDPVTGLFKNSGTLVGWGPESGETTFADYDDIDDLDGLSFGDGGTYAGPLDSSGRVITQTDINGAVVTVSGVNQPLTGWRQTVTVEKVEPYNTGTVRADDYDAPTATVPMQVDDYSLRVTVVVTYQGPTDTARREMARVVWIHP